VVGWPTVPVGLTKELARQALCLPPAPRTGASVASTGKPAIISDDYFDEHIVRDTEPEDTTRENISADLSRPAEPVRPGHGRYGTLF
jgi:hypothetical protein